MDREQIAKMRRKAKHSRQLREIRVYIITAAVIIAVVAIVWFSLSHGYSRGCYYAR